MYSLQISDRDTFAKKARSLGRPVTIVRTATVVPVAKGNVVVMHPALTIDYALNFDEPPVGETRWSFREVILTDDQGDAHLTGSLLEKLQADPLVTVRIGHRSGSF